MRKLGIIQNKDYNNHDWNIFYKMGGKDLWIK